MAYEALCALGLSFLSSLSSLLFPSTQPAPATLAFFLFPKHKQAPSCPEAFARAAAPACPWSSNQSKGTGIQRL